jgi:hypothetical protein
MSKLKTPRAKKVASLARDRRNRYAENSKASRKNIPRSKARTQRAHRRAVHIALAANELVSDVGLEHAETSLAQAARDRKLHGFRNKPDTPLGIVLADRSDTAETEPEHFTGGWNAVRAAALERHGRVPTRGTPRRPRKP